MLLFNLFGIINIFLFLLIINVIMKRRVFFERDIFTWIYYLKSSSDIRLSSPLKRTLTALPFMNMQYRSGGGGEVRLLTKIFKILIQISCEKFSSACLRAVEPSTSGEPAVPSPHEIYGFGLGPSFFMNLFSSIFSYFQNFKVSL